MKQFIEIEAFLGSKYTVDVERIIMIRPKRVVEQRQEAEYAVVLDENGLPIDDITVIYITNVERTRLLSLLPLIE